MEIREHVALAPLTTFGIGGAARWFVEVTTEAEVAEAVHWAEERGLPLLVLGGGSNLLVRDAGFAGLVVRIGVMGIEDSGEGLLEVGAGESWARGDRVPGGDSRECGRHAGAERRRVRAGGRRDD